MSGSPESTRSATKYARGMSDAEPVYAFEDLDRCPMCHAPIRDCSVLGRRLWRAQGVFPRRLSGVTTAVMRCDACGLLFANPLPRPTSVAAHYDVTPEEYWAEHRLTANAAEGGFRPTATLFTRLWGGRGTPAALDIGAGLGATMRTLDEMGFDAWGLEPSATFATEAVAGSLVPTERLAVVAVEDAVYEPDSFDFVILGAVLEHVYHPSAVLDRACSWLRPGGLVYIEVPSAKWLTARMANLLYKITSPGFVANLSPMHPPYHLTEFTPAAFAAYAYRARYEVALVRHFVGDRTYLPRPFDGLLRPLMRCTRTGMQLEVWIRRPT